VSSPAAPPRRAPRLSARELASALGLHPPTDEQAAVIESPLAPAVVIAGAGSGKTETTAARVVWLIANRLVSPAAVLGLTFTRKAAAELAGRIRHRLGQWRAVVAHDAPDDTEHLAELVAGEPTVLTYAAYAGRLVADHAMRLGAEPQPRQLSPAMCWQLADSVVRRYQGALPENIGAMSSVPRYVLTLSQQLADHLVTVDDLERLSCELMNRWQSLPIGASTRCEYPGDTRTFVDATHHRLALLPLVRQLAEAKTNQSAADFAEQMTLAARLAAVPAVARIEQEQYAAVLLDEYQDTGHAQVLMLSRLFGAGHPVTAVGDPFQSIYAWRGASVGTMRRFPGVFRAADGSPAPTFPLATSWRNDRAVLDSANAVAAPLRAHDPIAVQLRPRPLAGSGQVHAAVLETVQDEAHWLAHQMRSLWDERPAGDRTAAVLVRRRSQICMIRDALVAAGLPVEVVGLGGLLAMPEIIDVVATLRVLGDHKAGAALARLLTGARWRIGPRDLAALSRRARQLQRQAQPVGPQMADARTSDPGESAEPVNQVEPLSLVEALDDLGSPDLYSATGYARLQACADELRALRHRLAVALPELVADVERTIGVDLEVAARADRAVVGRAHLDRFLDEAARFAADAEQATLSAFLAFLEAAETEEYGLDAAEADVAKERVQVLTVHAAKGLEWDVVAVPGLVDAVFPATAKGVDWTRSRQILPSELRGDRDEVPALSLVGAADRRDVARRLERHTDEVRAHHEHEERRLAYVAFTRARSVLLVSGYVWDTARKPRAVSPFLAELRDSAEVDTWFVVKDGAPNPLLAGAAAASWPVDPLGSRRPDVVAGAELVRAALAEPQGSPQRSGRGKAARTRAASWSRDVDVLLAERSALAAGSVTDVALPSSLSVSQLVLLRQDPHRLARSIRRPVPERPAPLARRGTRFHAWLEERWGRQPLLDVDELPGAADEGNDDAEFEALRQAFTRSVWVSRTPIDVEVPFEMELDGSILRGRMDAVFADRGGGWTVVDWKTGRPPSGIAADAAAVQLAVYRLAWAALCGLGESELTQIRAAFHYVSQNVTVHPVDLLDADGLRRLLAGTGRPTGAAEPAVATSANVDDRDRSGARVRPLSS
jgi:DNA helicase II / ATP-dependent DNA helicase PcrA